MKKTIAPVAELPPTEPTTTELPPIETATSTAPVGNSASEPTGEMQPDPVPPPEPATDHAALHFELGHPSEGGSYIREADGSLVKQEG